MRIMVHRIPMQHADDTDDAAAWNASLWPPAQDGEMYKNFASPIKGETEASKRVFYGVTKFALVTPDLVADAAKEFDLQSLKQRWSNELARNGQGIDLSSDIFIRHEIHVFSLAKDYGFIKSDTLCYVNINQIRTGQINVVFPFKGELRRATVGLWMSNIDTASALPKQKSDTARGLVNQSIRSAAREFDLRR